MTTLAIRQTQRQMFSPAVYKLLVALLVLVSVTLISIGLLLILRRLRHQREGDLLPRHKTTLFTTRRSHHRGSAVDLPLATTSNQQQQLAPFSASQEKQELLHSVPSRSPTPIPEIRVHFPPEVDEYGKQAPGKIVVVRIGEKSIGMEPVGEEELPPYRPLRVMDEMKVEQEHKV